MLFSVARPLTKLVSLTACRAPGLKFCPRHVKNGQGRWCSDISTLRRETCADMIGRALPLDLADLKVRYSADMSKWRWRDAHPAVSDHRPLRRQLWLSEWFNISVPTAGDNYT